MLLCVVSRLVPRGPEIGPVRAEAHQISPHAAKRSPASTSFVQMVVCIGTLIVLCVQRRGLLCERMSNYLIVNRFASNRRCVASTRISIAADAAVCLAAFRCCCCCCCCCVSSFVIRHHIITRTQHCAAGDPIRRAVAGGRVNRLLATVTHPLRCRSMCVCFVECQPARWIPCACSSRISPLILNMLGSLISALHPSLWTAPSAER